MFLSDGNVYISITVFGSRDGISEQLFAKYLKKTNNNTKQPAFLLLSKDGGLFEQTRGDTQCQ